jgi:hypothetical protein
MEKNFESMPNKQFAYSCLQLIASNNKLDASVMNILTNEDECRERFQCSGKLAVLKEVPLKCCDEELTTYCYDRNGRQRYYKEQIFVIGKAYVVTNHWYGPDKTMPENRTPFLMWIKSKI